MRKALIYLISLTFCCQIICFGGEDAATYMMERFPGPVDQDLFVRDRVLSHEISRWDSRYDLIKPVFNFFQDSFSVLDLGSAQGYFAFRIAHDYPHANCTIIDENSFEDRDQGDLLYDLCLMNQLDNVTYLRKRLTYRDLCFLSAREHFDVVLVFLVVHQMAEKLSDQQMIFERLLSLGDHLLVEVADDEAVDFGQFIASLCKYSDCEYLGEVPRFQNPARLERGRLYWFKSPKRASGKRVHRETFRALNGVYPSVLLD